MKKLLLAALVLLTTAACHMNADSNAESQLNIDEQQEAMLEETKDNAGAPAATAFNKASANEVAGPDNSAGLPRARKMIWTADIRYQVKNVDETTEKIQDLCERHGAFVANMRFSSTPTELSNYIEIRTENKEFQKLIQAFRKTATFVDQYDVSSEDVTEEYVDIESRLKTKREVRDRYIEVLRNKAANVEDILAAENAIRQVTEEIEVIEGRLRYLNDQVNYSTIRLNIYQKVDYKETPTTYEKPYSSELSDGFSEGWEAIKLIFLGLITLWPLWILLGLGLWKGKWLWKKIFGRRHAG